MRAAKIPWVRHQNDQSILSIDIQPNGFRFVTGGGDSAVCVWNLLPVIGEKFERQGQTENQRVQDPNDDIEMAGDQSSYQSLDNSESDSDPEERAKFEQRDKDIERDVALMESLFQNEAAKSQRLLAVLTTHNSPVNCVRWNNLGSMFASADDEGTIILWEYRGLTV